MKRQRVQAGPEPAEQRVQDEAIKQLLEGYHEHLKHQVARSYVLQSADEQKRRLQAVLHLSVELGAIRQKTIFATAIAERVIESVIVGDWRACYESLRDLEFNDYPPSRARFAPVYADFRHIGYAAIQRSVRPQKQN